MQTIHTKYLPWTDTKPGRVKAFTQEGESITIPWDDDINIGANHTQAAKMLKDKLGWPGEMIGGNTKEGLVFVFAYEVHRIDY